MEQRLLVLATLVDTVTQTLRRDQIVVAAQADEAFVQSTLLATVYSGFVQ